MISTLFLENLSLINFKNWGEGSFRFTQNINCFLGKNGSGKTNLLDAIHYLSLGKSNFNPVDSQNIKFEAPFFMVQGAFRVNQASQSVICSVKKGAKKKLKLGEKEYEKLADHVGKFPVVIISPYDSILISEGSEERRKFMDAIIAQFNADYLDKLIAYNRILAQRNALLKQMQDTRNFSTDLLQVYDMQLVELAPEIHKYRISFIEKFAPILSTYYKEISNNAELADLVYESQLNENKLEDLLIQNAQKDYSRGFTTSGIHKDDLIFNIDGVQVKKYASQGQRKSFLLALKLAKFEMLQKEKDFSPILLLDDIFDKMDEERLSKLMHIVSGEIFGQVFLTDAHLTRLPDLLNKLNQKFEVFTIEK
jgi:DNA replication and repair protein RecF